MRESTCAGDATRLSAIGMVKSVEISNFRAFEKLVVPELSRVNIVDGDNGVAKPRGPSRRSYITPTQTVRHVKVD